MNKIINDLMDNKWWQEFAVVAFSFTIYTLKNDWMFISSLGSIMLGVLFYIILYVIVYLISFIILLTNRSQAIIYKNVIVLTPAIYGIAGQ